MDTKINWRVTEVTSIGGCLLPKDLCYTEHSVTLGKVILRINSKNLRLSAWVGNRVTFLGGDDGYFHSIVGAQNWVSERAEKITACKSMEKLIYIK